MIDVKVVNGKVTGEIEGTMNDICNDVFNIMRSLVEHLCETNVVAGIFVIHYIQKWLRELNPYDIQKADVKRSVTYDMSKLRQALNQIFAENDEKEEQEDDIY